MLPQGYFFIFGNVQAQGLDFYDSPDEKEALGNGIPRLSKIITAH